MVCPKLLISIPKDQTFAMIDFLLANLSLLEQI